jgi:hypothetical protein
VRCHAPAGKVAHQAHGGDKGKERKFFFFEKKKQNFFINCVEHPLQDGKP